MPFQKSFAKNGKRRFAFYKRKKPTTETSSTGNNTNVCLNENATTTVANHQTETSSIAAADTSSSHKCPLCGKAFTRKFNMERHHAQCGKPREEKTNQVSSSFLPGTNSTEAITNAMPKTKTRVSIDDHCARAAALELSRSAAVLEISRESARRFLCGIPDFSRDNPERCLHWETALRCVVSCPDLAFDILWVLIKAAPEEYALHCLSTTRADADEAAVRSFAETLYIASTAPRVDGRQFAGPVGRAARGNDASVLLREALCAVYAHIRSLIIKHRTRYFAAKDLMLLSHALERRLGAVAICSVSRA